MSFNLSPAARFVNSIFVLIFSLALACAAMADPVNKQEITAMYINTISKAILWPNSSTSNSFKIGVIGDQNKLIVNPLLVLTKNSRIQNLPVTVESVDLSSDLSGFNVIYIEGANSKLVEQFYEAVGSNPVLLITTESLNKQSVMINLLPQIAGRMKFEVNKSNIINQGLKPLPELILAGGTEIDVAKLFKDTQESLVNLGKQLQLKEKSLNDLTTNIQHQEVKNTLLEKKMTQLSAEIEKSEASIQEKNAMLKKSEANRLDLAQEVDMRTNQINSLQSSLVKIQSEIDKREARVASLNNTIKAQEQEITSQNDSIANLGTTVNFQRLKIAYMYVIAGGIFILCVVALYSRRIIKRKNVILEATKKDLLILTNRLSIAKKKADDASKAKGDFLSLMSHELRTPLQAIIGYTEVAIDSLKRKEIEDDVSDLQKVITNSERLLKLINGILDLAKIEAGRMPVDLAEIKVSSLVEESLSITSPLLKRGNNKISVDVDDGSFLPTADPEKIVTILVNLIGNSIKFTQDGLISVKAHHETNRLLLQVSDTGCGIPPEKIKGIFDKFSQARTSATSKVVGNGLGLSIVREMAECMGGTASVESKIGVGSTFTVSIPLPIDISSRINTDALLVSLPQNNYEAQNDDNTHVLIIDDDPATSDVMRRILTKDGYMVHTARSAESGFSQALEISPDLIAVGLSLPDAYCLKLIERIKEQKLLNNIPLIILSAEEGSPSEIMACDAFLTKPIRHEILRNTVSKLLTKKQSSIIEINYN